MAKEFCNNCHQFVICETLLIVGFLLCRYLFGGAKYNGTFSNGLRTGNGRMSCMLDFSTGCSFSILIAFVVVHR
jgi:hypothetical protein